MKKIWNQLGAGPWDYEIDVLSVEQGMDRYKAKCLVIMNWMKAGDARPLLAAIKEDGVLRGPVLGLLVQMIKSGELTFRKGRGHPADPEAAVRDQLAADTYEDFLKDHKVGSDDLFRAIGSVAGASVESIRQAVTTKRRKPKPK